MRERESKKRPNKATLLFTGLLVAGGITSIATLTEINIRENNELPKAVTLFPDAASNEDLVQARQLASQTDPQIEAGHNPNSRYNKAVKLLETQESIEKKRKEFINEKMPKRLGWQTTSGYFGALAGVMGLAINHRLIAQFRRRNT